PGETGGSFQTIPVKSLYSSRAAIGSGDIQTVTTWCTRVDSLRTNANSLINHFTVFNGKKYVVSMWVKEALDCAADSYKDAYIYAGFQNGSGSQSVRLMPKGNIIEG